VWNPRKLPDWQELSDKSHLLGGGVGTMGSEYDKNGLEMQCVAMVRRVVPDEETLEI